MKKILITGGSGFIGSHMIKFLEEKNSEFIFLDKISTQFSNNIKRKNKFYHGDITDKIFLNKVFTENNINKIMHFASFIDLRESISNPSLYYWNNVVGTLLLLNTMLKFNVKKIIFSSSASVYGIPQCNPINENHPINPLSPYGKTKQFIEQIIKDYSKSYGLNYVIFRYFNVAGASPDIEIGEAHEPETHLIPNILKVAFEKKEIFEIFGNNYNTHDGTCIRDYVHVYDICLAHWLANKYMNVSKIRETYNIGSNSGYSILQVLDKVKEITGIDIPYKVVRKKKGDSHSLVADSNKIRDQFNWKPKYSDLGIIIKHGWEWEKKSKIN